jgi:hypothetical protein
LYAVFKDKKIDMGLFNLPKAKQFNYRPLYYDEQKERMEKLKANATGNHLVGLQKGFLQEQRQKSKLHKRSLEKISMLRFFVILFALVLLLYFIAPEIFQAMWPAKTE